MTQIGFRDIGQLNTRPIETPERWARRVIELEILIQSLERNGEKWLETQGKDGISFVPIVALKACKRMYQEKIERTLNG